MVFDYCISLFFEVKMDNRYNEQIYSTYSAKTDVAIIGASRAAHHYVPSVIEDSLHMSATNYGIDGQNIFTHYIMLKSLLEHSQIKPMVVILEIGAIDVNNTPKWNTEKLNLIYPYYKSERFVKEMLVDVLDPKESAVLNLSGLYRHNSKYIGYLNRLINGFPQLSDGYRPLTKQWNKPIEFNEKHEDGYHLKKIKYIEKFITTCKQENIKVVIAVSPHYKLLPEEKWVKKVVEIAEDMGVPFLYHEKDTIYHKHKEWFNEPFHLNDEGAHFYTKQICHELKSFCQ